MLLEAAPTENNLPRPWSLPNTTHLRALGDTGCTQTWWQRAKSTSLGTTEPPLPTMCALPCDTQPRAATSTHPSTWRYTSTKQPGASPPAWLPFHAPLLQRSSSAPILQRDRAGAPWGCPAPPCPLPYKSHPSVCPGQQRPWGGVQGESCPSADAQGPRTVFLNFKPSM